MWEKTCEEHHVGRLDQARPETLTDSGSAWLSAKKRNFFPRNMRPRANDDDARGELK